MITNRVLEFILIAAPFVVLGGLLRRRCGFGIVILTAVLFLNFLFTALTSPIPLRWLFVVGPMALGCGIGLFAHSHKTFLLFQIMLGVLASLMSQIYKYYWAEWDPEGYGIVMLSKWGYSVINLTELLLLFFVILLIMRLLKLENKGWALLLALCLLSLDIDPIFLSYALVPIICSTLVGHYVRETGLEPSRILRIMEEIVGRYRRIV